jgi:uncharacterized protein (TIGR00369 family)
MTGLEILHHTLVEHPAPIVDLVNMRVDELDEGRVVFSVEPHAGMLNPIGVVHGGIAATLLDSVMGCAVHSTLGPGVGYTTADLHVHFVRAVTPETGRITGTGVVSHVGRRMATATGEIVDGDGRLVAHGSTTCLILPTSAPD